MTNNKDKGINLIEYNYSNLITGLLFEETYIPNPYSRPVNARTNYRYDSNGTKLRKTRNTGLKASIGETIEITDYLTGFHYLAVTTDDGNNNINITPPTLQFIPTAEGYYDFVQKSYIYNYVDHLGNVRLSYVKNQSTGAVDVIEENNYYAFGLKHEGYNDRSISTSYNYKYNGKELQETGMYDYGARMYMPDIGRWGVIDNKAEKYTTESPYNYALNNPIKFIDPDGNEVYCPSCKTAEDWANYRGYWENALEMTGQNMYTGLLNSNIKVSFMDGNMKHPVVSVNGEVQDLENRSRLDAFGDFYFPIGDIAGITIIKQGGWFSRNIINPIKSFFSSGESKAENVVTESASKIPKNKYSPKESLRRSKNGEPKVDSEAQGTEHTQLGTKKGRKGDYTQGREFDREGNPVRDIDHTDHGRSQDHSDPHQHRWEPNKTGGTPRRLGPEPLR